MQAHPLILNVCALGDPSGGHQARLDSIFSESLRSVYIGVPFTGAGLGFTSYDPRYRVLLVRRKGPAPEHADLGSI